MNQAENTKVVALNISRTTSTIMNDILGISGGGKYEHIYFFL